MKHVKFVMVALVLCYVTPLFGQSNLVWSNKVFHPEAIHTAGFYNGIVLDNNGDACVVGEAFNGVNNSLVVGKVAVDGAVIWTKNFDYDSQLKRSIKGGIGVDVQNNIYITGHQIKTSESSNDISDLFLMKISAAGELLWTRIYDSGFNDKMDFNGILVNSSGDVIIAAMQYNTLNPNYNDLLFVKYSGDGSLVWEKTVDGGNYEFLRSVTMDANENIYAAFQIYNYNEVSPNSIAAAKLSSNGELQWYKVFPWENTKFLFSNINNLAVNEQGEVFIIGHMNTPVNNDFDLLTVKYDANGILLWSQIFNSGSTDYCASIVPDKNGSVVVTCNSFDPSISGYYSNVIKYNSEGEMQWKTPAFKSNVVGSFSWNYDMTTDGESNYFLVGFSYTNGKLIAKSAQLDQDGKVEWTEDFVDDGSSFVYGYDIVTDGVKAVYVFGTSQRASEKNKTKLFVAKYPIVKKIVDVTPPIAIAKNIAVTLVEGKVQISVDQINDGSADASGIDTLFISTSSFSCSDIGENKVVLTVIDVFGNVAADTSVVIVLGAIPAVSILQGEQTKYCQGGAIVLTANSNTATAYNWNDGDASKCKSVYASGNYTLTVSNKYGCTAMASTSVVYNPSNLLSAYTILAGENILLTPNVNVINGGVGSKGCGQIIVNAGSRVTSSNSFVRAKKIIYASGTIANPIFSQATVSYPTFLANTLASNKNKNIAANSEVIVNDSVFANLTIGNYSKVVFTSRNIYAKNMELGKNVTIEFTQCTNVRLTGNFSTGINCEVNIAQSKSVLFFVGGNAEISNGSKVRAGIFSKGNIQSTGSDKKQNYLTGMFIALQEVKAHNTIFDREEMCNSCFSSSFKMADEQHESFEVISTESNTFEAYPNPTVNNGNISFMSTSDKQITVSIYDAKGVEVLNIFKGEISMNQLYNFSFDTSTFTSGFYFCKISSSDGEVLTKKLTVER